MGGLVLFLASLVPVYSNPSQSMVVPLDERDSEGEWPVWRWEVLAGDDALRAGLPSLAEGLFRNALRQESLSVESRQLIYPKLVAALISQRKIQEAKAVLDSMPVDGAGYYLRQALVSFSMLDWEGVERNLAEVALNRLSSGDRPWYYLLQGLTAERAGDREDADRWFSLAVEESASSAQRAQFEALILRGQIISGEANDALVEQLEQKLLLSQGTRVGFQLARQLAVVLDQLGRKEQAIATLQEQLKAISSNERHEQDQMLLYLGLIAGSDSARGQEALRAILRGRGERDVQSLALYLLAGGERVSENPAEFRQFLDQLLTDYPNHPLRDELLFLRARMALAAGMDDKAAEDINRVLEEYPGSDLRGQAMRLRAYLAWNANPPRYRTAADYLNQLRLTLPPGTERTMIGRLVGDCYFLNGDYEAAADVYAAVLREEELENENGEVLFQLVLSYLRAGRYEEALRQLDRAVLLGKTDPLNRWRAEWNLVETMREVGKVQEAYERLEFILHSPEVEALPLALRIRLQWLESQLAYEMGQLVRVIGLCDRLAEDVEMAPEGTFSPEVKNEIQAHNLLLKGKALLALGEEEQSLALLQELRRQYADNEAAVLSLLEEARYFAGKFNLALAQQRLIELADTYPQSRQAGIALYEAAVIADKRASEATRKQALEILSERLIEKRPGDPLIFYARLLQGEILRNLNEFAAAQQLYENMLREFPDHPEIYLVELARSRSLLGQSTWDTTRLRNAAAGMERLFDLPDLPVDVRVEAGYSWAVILKQLDEPRRAKEVLWLVISRFLRDPQSSAQLGSNGRYWMARTVFELGNMLDSEGRTADAREVYQLILNYELPGRSLALSRLD